MCELPLAEKATQQGRLMRNAPQADFSSCISRLIRLAQRTNVSPVLLCMAPPSVTIGFLPFSIFLGWQYRLSNLALKIPHANFRQLVLGCSNAQDCRAASNVADIFRTPLQTFCDLRMKFSAHLPVPAGSSTCSKKYHKFIGSSILKG